MTTTDAINEALLGRLIDRLECEQRELAAGNKSQLNNSTGQSIRSNKLILKFGTPEQVHDVCLALAQHGSDADVNWVATNMPAIRSIIDPNAEPEEDDDEDDEEGL